MIAIQILKILENPLTSEDGIVGQGTLQAANVPAVPASPLRRNSYDHTTLSFVVHHLKCLLYGVARSLPKHLLPWQPWTHEKRIDVVEAKDKAQW